MSELELALTRLGRELDVPDAPDLATRVRSRLDERRRPVPWRRPLVVALAVLAVAAAAAMAVPQARSTILDWLGIGSVTIREVDELPKLDRQGAALQLGQRMSLGDARQRVQFTILLPTLDELEHPAVYYNVDVGAVSLLYGTEQAPKVLITEVFAPGAIDKLVTAETSVEPVREEGWTGAWLEGAEHAIYVPTTEAPLRLAGNTLVVQGGRDDTTVRIEADISKDGALRILRSMKEGAES